MLQVLSPGFIGLSGLALEDTIELAKATGYDGIDVNMREAAELAQARGVGAVRDLFERADILPAQWMLPVAWQREDRWQRDLAELPKLATLARELGCTRLWTWTVPGSNELDFRDNFAWYIKRFRPIAKVLEEQGCTLGLEFIGTPTVRAKYQYEFIYTLEGMLELVDTIGTDNLGLLLDVWHLYMSGGEIEDLDQLLAEDIVTVHVNDAPAGIPFDQQIDNVRCLPMETGVFDLPRFMRKLDELGYDGPVTPEPFSERVNNIREPLRAAQIMASAMDDLWHAAGLSR